MKLPRIIFKIALVLMALTSLPNVLAEAARYQWNDVNRVVVIPDVHGAYTALVELLQTTEIIDANLAWSGGASHLVSLGDLLDRGPDSRLVMDLFIRLQTEASQAGGQVHVVAGNHELMNLIGDLRYVSNEEFAAFAAEEIAPSSPAPDSSQVYPKGYFAHRQAFSATGRYGRWLLTLPAVITVNNIAYAHGGLSPLTAELSLSALNDRYRTTVTTYLSLWNELIDSGVLPQNSVTDAGKLARSILLDAQQSSCLSERVEECMSQEQTTKLQEFVTLSASPLLSDEGPLWFRGAAYCRALFEGPALQTALANIGATKLVVGHTTAPDARVHSLHDNQMTLLDTGMLVSHYKGRPAALVIENGKEQVHYLNPHQIDEPVQNNYPSAYTLSSNELLKAVKTGQISKLNEPEGAEHWPVQISYEGITLKARFIPEGKDFAAKRELAAELLDQLLGFELVPAAAHRELDGVFGTLQIVFDKSINEQQRSQSNTPVGGWCSFNRQVQLMHAYDLLINNTGRTAESIIYQLPRWQLQLIGHHNAFDGSKRLPKKLKKNAIDLHPQVRDALTQLTKQNLHVQLGDYLDDKSLDALLHRRDAMLKLFR